MRAENWRQSGRRAATISLRACSCAAGGAGATRPLQTAETHDDRSREWRACAVGAAGQTAPQDWFSIRTCRRLGSPSAVDSAPITSVHKLEALLSACAVPQLESPSFSEASPASMRTSAASDALRTHIFTQVTLEDLTDLRPPASGNGATLSRCDASVQIPSMLDFGSPAALSSTSPAHALLSPMIILPGDADKFSAKVTGRRESQPRGQHFHGAQPADDAVPLWPTPWHTL